MKSSRLSTVIGILAVAVLIAVFFRSIFSESQTGVNLIDQHVPAAISTFLSKDDLIGESFVLLSDSYEDECNQRFTEFTNLIVKLRGNGKKIRLLHSSRHGMPSKSYEESVTMNRGAPNHTIIAESSVLYADSTIRTLIKPSLIVLKDGVVVDVLVRDDFDNWAKR